MCGTAAMQPYRNIKIRDIGNTYTFVTLSICDSKNDEQRNEKKKFRVFA